MWHSYTGTSHRDTTSLDIIDVLGSWLEVHHSPGCTGCTSTRSHQSTSPVVAYPGWCKKISSAEHYINRVISDAYLRFLTLRWELVSIGKHSSALAWGPCFRIYYYLLAVAAIMGEVAMFSLYCVSNHQLLKKINTDCIYQMGTSIRMPDVGLVS